MGILDNSGDIILDAVLTDTGRRVMAHPSMAFKITHFRLGDDEINYSLYDTGSATGKEDITIMKTPIYEARSRSCTAIKSFVTTYSRNDLSYLPIIKLNTNDYTFGNQAGKPLATGFDSAGKYIVLATKTAVDAWTKLGDGMIDGQSARTATKPGHMIVLDEGLDTTETSYTQPMDAELSDSSFALYVDDRFARVASKSGAVRPRFVSDDFVATYIIEGAAFNAPTIELSDDAGGELASPIRGSRNTGMRPTFGIYASADLQSRSDYLFDRHGGTFEFFTGADLDTAPGGDATAKYIEMEATIVGLQTGARGTIPIKFVKQFAG